MGVERTGPPGERHPNPPALRSRLPVEWREVEVGPLRLGLWEPVDPDAILDTMTQEEFTASDDRMPYWALLWPSALALARVVVEGPSLVGRRVLDLGCGLGLCGLAALRARASSVTFLDWEHDAVVLAVASAEAAGFRGTVPVVADWRSPPPLSPFDLILGADVLYEERNAPGVAAFLARHLSPSGEAWIVDPGRLHASEFPSVTASAGLATEAADPISGSDGESSMSLRVFRRSLRGS